MGVWEGFALALSSTNSMDICVSKLQSSPRFGHLNSQEIL